MAFVSTTTVIWLYMMTVNYVLSLTLWSATPAWNSSSSVCKFKQKPKLCRAGVKETNLDCPESNWQTRRKNFSPSLTFFFFTPPLFLYFPPFFYFPIVSVFNLYFCCSDTLQFYSSLYLSSPHPSSHHPLSPSFHSRLPSIFSLLRFSWELQRIPKISTTFSSFFTVIRFLCPILRLLSSDFRVSCFELEMCLKKLI